MSPALDYSRIAHLYDSYVRFQDDVPFFLEECRRAQGPVLELMAGTGRVSLPLAGAGVELTCVDSSAPMLAVLRRKLAARGLRAAVLEADVARLDLPPVFPLALMPFHSFAEILDREERLGALQGIHAALVEGGAFLLTLHNPRVRLRSVGGGPALLGRLPKEDGSGEVALRADFHYDPASRRVRGTQVVEEIDEAGRTVEEHALAIEFVLLEEEEVRDAVESVGFRPESLLGGYDRRPYDPESSPFMIWSLRKAG
jgi:SAM-dependent methyltransferase